MPLQLKVTMPPPANAARVHFIADADDTAGVDRCGCLTLPQSANKTRRFMRCSGRHVSVSFAENRPTQQKSERGMGGCAQYTPLWRESRNVYARSDAQKD